MNYPIISCNHWLIDSISLICLALTIVGIYCFFRFPVRRDRILARGIWSTVGIVFCFIILVPFAVSGIALLIGIKPGEITGSTDNYVTDNLFLSLLYHFTDPGNLGVTSNGRALAFAWASGLLGVFLFAGLFVSTIVNIVDKRTEMWQKGLIRYNHHFSDYVVVIGGNEQVAAVVKDSLAKPGVKYVLILTSSDVENLRMRINASLSSRDEGRVVIYYGDQTSLEEIKGLRLQHAREIFILGESTRTDANDNHDAFNMNTLRHISTCADDTKPGQSSKGWYGLGKRGSVNAPRPKLKCHVAIEHQTTFTIFKYAEIAKKLTQRIEFLPFNVDDIWAKRVFVDRKYCLKHGKFDDERVDIEYAPLWGDNAIGPDSRKTVHLVIAGTDSAGVALALEAAQLLHFPNFVIDHSLRSTITFISPDAEKEANYLFGRFPHLFALCRSRVIDLGKESIDKPWHDPMTDPDSRYRHLGENFMDIQWEFIQANVADAKARDYLVSLVENPDKITTVATSLEYPHKSLAAALYLPEKVLQRAVQILVYQNNMLDIVDYLALPGTNYGKYCNIKPFGMIENCYEEISADTVKAKLINYFYNHNPNNEEITYEQIVGTMEERWKRNQSLPRKWSSNNNADAIDFKLAAAGLSPTDPFEKQKRILTEPAMLHALAGAEHNRWVIDRLLAGLRPLDDTDDEWRYFLRPEIMALRTRDDNKKTAKKKKLSDDFGAHLDIVPNELLEIIDKGISSNDRCLVSAIPLILRLAKEAEKR